jgi:hypothetical protein
MGAVPQYFEAMKSYDWAVLRACLTDDFTRDGPYEGHVFGDPDTYIRFLADLLPTLRGQVVELTRLSRADDVVYSELTETIEVDGKPHTIRGCAAFELSGDGRIRHVEVFVRRLPRAEEAPPA